MSADTCTLLDYTVGTVAGKQCGLVKRIGLPVTEVYGGQRFRIKVRTPISALPCVAALPSLLLWSVTAHLLMCSRGR